MGTGGKDNGKKGGEDNAKKGVRKEAKKILRAMHVCTDARSTVRMSMTSLLKARRQLKELGMLDVTDKMTEILDKMNSMKKNLTHQWRTAFSRPMDFLDGLGRGAEVKPPGDQDESDPNARSSTDPAPPPSTPPPSGSGGNHRRRRRRSLFFAAVREENFDSEGSEGSDRAGS